MKSELILSVMISAVIGTVLGYPRSRSKQLIQDAVLIGESIESDQNDSDDTYATVYQDRKYFDSDTFTEPDSAETVYEDVQHTSSTRDDIPFSLSDSKSQNEKSLKHESQNFYPSFAELLDNHRLSYAEEQQQFRFRPNRFLGYVQRDRSSYQGTLSAPKDNPPALLGSGNFGVIRGGTYYPDNEETDEYSANDDSNYKPYPVKVPRGRANYLKNPKPQFPRSGDFFANFRDFADITAPPKSSFSHLSIVYTNRNDTARHASEPRNIIETLNMLDEVDCNSTSTIESTETPVKKVSLGKRKLAAIKRNENDEARKIRMFSIEPLLALS